MARFACCGLVVVAAFGLVIGKDADRHTMAASRIRTAVGVNCAAEIDRFQSIVTSDHESGNVAETVYQEIEADLSRALAACAAGKTGEAHAIVTASKARHGYRA